MDQLYDLRSRQLTVAVAFIEPGFSLASDLSSKALLI